MYRSLADILFFTIKRYSVTSNAEYVEKMKNQIFETLRILDQDKITDKHLRWEYLKYEIRKFTMTFSKNQTHENQTLKCEGAITESEFLKDLPSMDNDK